MPVDGNRPIRRHQDFREFYAEHADPIYRALVVTIGDPTLAADATSEAMTRACQRWTSVQAGPNPPGWVYRVGLNWSRSRWRKLRRERPLDHQVEESTTELDPTIAVLQEAVSRLELAQRSVVVLRYYLDWTPTEIATSLDIPVGTVKSRLHRALKVLKVDLENPRLQPEHAARSERHGIDLRGDIVDLTNQPNHPRPDPRRARKGRGQ